METHALRTMRIFLAVLAITSGSGCATMISGRTSTVRISSSPAGVQYEVREGDLIVREGVTPEAVALKSDGIYTVVFKQRGLDVRRKRIGRNFNSWFFMNAGWGIAGLIVGAIVDASSGAVWELDTLVHATLNLGRKGRQE